MIWNDMDPVFESVGEPGFAVEGPPVVFGESAGVLEPGSEKDPGPPTGPAALRQALLELDAIHRAEQAVLLSEAAEIQLARLQLEAGRFPMYGAIPTDRGQSAWARALREERRFARADGLPFSPLLELLHHRLSARGRSRSGREAGIEPGGLSGTLDLARAAVALEPWPESRLTLARVLVASGAERAAREQLDAIESTPGVDWSSPAARVLRTAIVGFEAAVAEWGGDPGRALELFVLQLSRNPGFHPAAMTLGLGLVLGDHAAFERGRRSLAQLYRASRSPRSRTWNRAAASLRSLLRCSSTDCGSPASESVAWTRGLDPWSRDVVTLIIGNT